MITAAKINELFNKFTSLTADADPVMDRNMNDLMMFAIDSDHVDFDGDRLTFAQGAGPLKSVEIERICGAADLCSHMAIVMPASVILVNKRNGALSVAMPNK
ncbi:MAG: hypothetical protein K2F96_01275 [Muribaculaceae bacterium]|nr:hypothetical protein [Muribaculaceae bacterium]